MKIDKIQSGTGAKIKIQDDGSYIQIQEVWLFLYRKEKLERSYLRSLT